MRPGRLIQSQWIATRRTGDGLSVGYEAGNDRWWLWRPCHKCGGVQVPLLFGPGIRDGVYDVDSLEKQMADRCCPGCETQRHRATPGGREPAVWFDTLLSDWVVLIADPRGPGAILPLEIGGFDAPEALVYRNASDIAHSGDVFE
jgi:hypothetical protein